MKLLRPAYNISYPSSSAAMVFGVYLQDATGKLEISRKVVTL